MVATTRNQSIANLQIPVWATGFFASFPPYQSYPQPYAHFHNKSCPVAFKLHHYRKAHRTARGITMHP